MRYEWVMGDDERMIQTRGYREENHHIIMMHGRIMKMVIVIKING